MPVAKNPESAACHGVRGSRTRGFGTVACCRTAPFFHQNTFQNVKIGLREYDPDPFWQNTARFGKTPKLCNAPAR